MTKAASRSKQQIDVQLNEVFAHFPMIDASGKKDEFDLGKCNIQFDFAKIWMYFRDDAPD